VIHFPVFKITKCILPAPFCLHHIHQAGKPTLPDMNAPGSGRNRASLQPGCTVDIVRKENQRSGKKTRGIVRDILTNSSTHPHGIKVRLADGQVGRVAEIIETSRFSSVSSEKTQPQPITPAETSRK
jgi:uncharacterized repeat protein (TIGR03833 family)